MPALSDSHRRRLDEWLGPWEVVADHSWPLQQTAVLRVDASGQDLIVKASDAGHHILREIAAHREHLGSYRGWVPTLVHASVVDGILVTEYLPGALVEGTLAEGDPTIYRQAGERLRQLLVPGEISPTYAGELAARSLALIDAAEGLATVAVLRSLRKLLASTRLPDAHLTFTHGDFQPRNWLLHDGELRIIDFGRADQRPWTSELVRMNNQQFIDRPDLELAFHHGLDCPLSEEDHDLLTLETIQQSIGTVVWANSIGDDDFEQHGRRMIEHLLTRAR